ncbi:MAG: outer membrane beta-barrel protein [candidate division Zixibacteria bacterium]|nr:outer membrane beta-barrel protein [candidate division Zixibacteria bacterium]
MRIAAITLVALLLSAVNSFAITGLGIGVRGGYITGLDMGGIEDGVKLLDPNAEVDDQMTMVGAHLRVGTLPIIDFDIAAEYAWKNMELYDDYKLDFKILAVTATGFYKILPTPMITPYVGLGVGSYTLTYDIKTPAGSTPVFDPDKTTKFGYHGVIGAKIKPPMFPLGFFARYRYTYISTEDDATKFSTILVGATFSLP